MFLKNILLISIFLFSFNSFAADAKDNEFDKIKNSEAIKKMKNKDDDFHLYLDKKEVEKVNNQYMKIEIEYKPNKNDDKPYFKFKKDDEYLSSAKTVKAIFYLSGHLLENNGFEVYKLFNPFPEEKVINLKKPEKKEFHKEGKMGTYEYFFDLHFAYKFTPRSLNKLKPTKNTSKNLLEKDNPDNYIDVKDLKNTNSKNITRSHCLDNFYGQALGSDNYIKNIKGNVITKEGEKYLYINALKCTKNGEKKSIYKYLYLFKTTLDVSISITYYNK